MKKKNLCDNCKKEIEEQTAKFIRPLCSWFFIVFILIFINLIIVLGTKGTEIFSLGERIIILILALPLCFTLFIPYIRNGITDLKKNYELIHSTKFYVLRNIWWLPHTLFFLYFFLNLTIELYSGFLYRSAMWSFLILFSTPFIINYIKKREVKKK